MTQDMYDSIAEFGLSRGFDDVGMRIIDRQWALTFLEEELHKVSRRGTA